MPSLYPRLRRLLGLTCLGAAVLRGQDPLPPEPDAKPQVQAGREFQLRWDPVRRDLPVYVPSDYSDAHHWPVVVFYHGLNGEPTTALFQDLTGGKGAIIVGMEYLERGLVRRTAAQQQAYQAKERAQLERLLEELPRRVRLDRNQVFLAGLSQGGWQVSALAESAKPRVAGYVILLAGRFPRAETARPDLSERVLYVGTGENDEANVYARMARQYFERCGAQVTWEEYAGRGHQMGTAVPRLRAWVALQLTLAPEARQREADLWLKDGLAEAERAADAKACHALLENLADDPRGLACSADLRQHLRAFLERVRMSPEVQPEVQARRVYERALWLEQTATALADLEEALELYRQVRQRYGQTPVGQRVQSDIDRVRPTVEKGQARRRQRAPAPPRPRLRTR